MRLALSVFETLGFYIGKMARETGLALDYHGSRLSKDIAYLEPLSRHRNLMGLYDRIPLISSTSFIAQNASLVGEVMVGEGTSIWYGATLRGDHAAIRLGNNTIVGDHSVLKATHSLPTGIPNSITIGNNVFIGNNCTIIASVIDDSVTVGPRTVIAEGCQLERGCVIGANSYVPPGKLVPAGQLWEGNPIQFVRDLNEKDRLELEEKAQQIRETALVQDLGIKRLE